MSTRKPRGIGGGRPVFIEQLTVDGTRVFPSTELYCHFVKRLNEAKEKTGFHVQALGLSPGAVRMILVPRGKGIEAVLHGMFTSAAKKFRCNYGGRGHVFAEVFDSRVLRTSADLRRTKEKLVRSVAKETKGLVSPWPFIGTDSHPDRFGVCGEKKTNRCYPTNRYFMTRNGLPTLYWYLSLIDDVRKLLK
jgi:hypothetical protein